VVSGGTTPSPAAPATEVALPTPNVGWDYQIGGALTPARRVGVVSRDRNAAPSPGDYNICYVNAYQTQPDEQDFWMDDPEHWRLVLTDENGDPVVDGQVGRVPARHRAGRQAGGAGRRRGGVDRRLRRRRFRRGGARQP